jgi:hypothetical protein
MSFPRKTVDIHGFPWPYGPQNTLGTGLSRQMAY